MLTRSVGVLLVAAVWVCSASAGGPADALVRAVERSNQATTASISLTEQVKAGGKTLTTLRISGVERPRTNEGSFRYVITPAQPGLGTATILVRGSSVYVHYPAFDALRAANPAAKKWLLADTKSSLGVNPTGLSSLGVKEIRAMTGLAVVGTGTEDGVRVTRYRGTLALSKLANSPQLQSLFASVPSEVSSLLRGTEKFEIAVGKDGFIHRMNAVIAAPLSDGTKLSITIAAELSQFNKPLAPIAFPTRSQVMTLAQFQKLTGTGTSDADNALLEKIVLDAAEVGDGYTRTVIPGGKLVDGETTLDFCEQTYQSESRRNARLQVAFDVKGTRPGASNEVVIYEAGGAQQALGEIKKALSKCRNGRLANAPAGVKNLTREFHTVSRRGLLPGAIAIVETDSAIVKGKHVTDRFAIVYQVRGNVLSAVYAAGGTPQSVEKLALDAAVKSAAKLRTNVAVGSDIR